MAKSQPSSPTPAPPTPQIPTDRRAPNSAWPVIRRAVDRRVPDGMRNLLVRTWQTADQQRFEHTGSPAHAPVFYRCTYCEWLGTLDEAADDASVGHEGTLCPECFSHIEPSEAEHTGSSA